MANAVATKGEKQGKKKGKVLVDPRSIEMMVQARARMNRAIEAHRMIPVATFASPDFHVLMTTRGDFIALWETEGIDSSCLSIEAIEEHHRLLTQAINEADPRLMIHTYFVKDRVAYATAKPQQYRVEVVNAVDAAQGKVLSNLEYFSTRVVFCLEWKTPFQVAATWLQKISPMFKDVLTFWNAESRKRFQDRLNFLLGVNEPAVEAGDRELLMELAEYQDACDGFLSKLKRIKLGEAIDSSAAEGVGAAALDFVPLKGRDAYNFLSRLWNWDGVETPFLPSVNHLAHFIASKNECDFGRYPDVVFSGGTPVGLYTVRELRDPVDYDVLRHFRNLPAEMLIHTRYMPMGVDQSSKFLAQKVSQARRMGGFVKGDPLRDKRIEDMNAAMQESVRGRPFGDWSCTIAIAGEDVEDLRAKRRNLEQLASQVGVVLRRESMNLDFTWLSIWPNNHVFEFHKLAAQSSLAAGALMPYRMPEGYGTRPPSGQVFPEPLCTMNAYTLEGGTGAPTRVWLGVADLNYFVIYGRPGGGKSFTVNFFVTNYARYAGTVEKPVGLKQWIIDRGDSYAPLCEVMGGAYIRVGDPDSPSAMNPLDLPPSEIRASLDRLVPFIAMLLTASATAKIELNEKDTGAISRALVEMAQNMERIGRRGSLPHLAEFLKGKNDNLLYEKLMPWIPGEDNMPDGDYCHVFPDEQDGFSSSDFVVWNFDDKKVGPTTEGPIMAYILMKLGTYVVAPENRAVRKFLFVDEAAIFITPKAGNWKSEWITAELRSTIRKAIKEWRKFNGALGLATQEPRDFQFDEALWETMRTGMVTRIFLQQDVTKALTDPERGYGVEMHLAQALNELPKGAMLMDQRGMRRFLQLKPDPTSYAIYSTDPLEAKFRFDYLKAHPIGEDNPAFKVFSEIGGHIADAKASGNKAKYLSELKF